MGHVWIDWLFSWEAIGARLSLGLCTAVMYISGKFVQSTHAAKAPGVLTHSAVQLYYRHALVL